MRRKAFFAKKGIVREYSEDFIKQMEENEYCTDVCEEKVHKITTRRRPIFDLNEMYLTSGIFEQFKKRLWGKR